MSWRRQTCCSRPEYLEARKQRDDGGRDEHISREAGIPRSSCAGEEGEASSWRVVGSGNGSREVEMDDGVDDG